MYEENSASREPHKFVAKYLHVFYSPEKLKKHLEYPNFDIDGINFLYEYKSISNQTLLSILEDKYHAGDSHAIDCIFLETYCKTMMKNCDPDQTHVKQFVKRIKESTDSDDNKRKAIIEFLYIMQRKVAMIFWPEIMQKKSGDSDDEAADAQTHPMVEDAQIAEAIRRSLEDQRHKAEELDLDGADAAFAAGLESNSETNDEDAPSFGVKTKRKLSKRAYYAKIQTAIRKRLLKPVIDMLNTCLTMSLEAINK